MGNFDLKKYLFNNPLLKEIKVNDPVDFRKYNGIDLNSIKSEMKEFYNLDVDLDDIKAFIDIAHSNRIKDDPDYDGEFEFDTAEREDFYSYLTDLREIKVNNPVDFRKSKMYTLDLYKVKYSDGNWGYMYQLTLTDPEGEVNDIGFKDLYFKGEGDIDDPLVPASELNIDELYHHSSEELSASKAMKLYKELLNK